MNCSTARPCCLLERSAQEVDKNNRYLCETEALRANKVNGSETSGANAPVKGVHCKGRKQHVSTERWDRMARRAAPPDLVDNVKELVLESDSASLRTTVWIRHALEEGPLLPWDAGGC